MNIYTGEVLFASQPISPSHKGFWANGCERERGYKKPTLIRAEWYLTRSLHEENSRSKPIPCYKLM